LAQRWLAGNTLIVPNALITTMIVLQLVMAAGLGMLIFRNGRNGSGPRAESEYTVASSESRPYQLAAEIPTTKDIYENLPFDAHLLPIERAALEEAFRLRIIKLWDVWLTGHQGKEATNFINGLRIAREGYHTALVQIDKRENALKEQR
jgi:hypothetical protein